MTDEQTIRQQKKDEMAQWSLPKKIEHSLKRIKEFYEFMEGKVYVSFSGGKDSTVLLHLVRSVYPDVPAVFSNTTNEFVEILQFVRSVDNVIWVQPKMSFKETIKEFGFPLISKMNARKVRTIKTKPNSASANLYLTGVNRKGEFHQLSTLPKKWLRFTEAPFDITERCCDILKKEPIKRFEKESELKPYIGTMSTESQVREKSWIDHGCNIYETGKECSRPLSIWTEDDVWAYIELNDVPYAKIYDDLLDDEGNVICKGEKRTGCAYCGFGLHLESPDEMGDTRMSRLQKRKPKQYDSMMKLSNNGVSFKEALDFYIGKDKDDILEP